MQEAAYRVIYYVEINELFAFGIIAGVILVEHWSTISSFAETHFCFPLILIITQATWGPFY